MELQRPAQASAPAAAPNEEEKAPLYKRQHTWSRLRDGGDLEVKLKTQAAMSSQLEKSKDARDRFAALQRDMLASSEWERETLMGTGSQSSRTAREQFAVSRLCDVDMGTGREAVAGRLPELPPRILHGESLERCRH